MVVVGETTVALVATEEAEAEDDVTCSSMYGSMSKI
jgi:hypothetical protein